MSISDIAVLVGTVKIEKGRYRRWSSEMEAPLLPVRGYFSQKSNLKDVVVDLAGGAEVLEKTLARWRSRHNWLALL